MKYLIIILICLSCDFKKNDDRIYYRFEITGANDLSAFVEKDGVNLLFLSNKGRIESHGKIDSCLKIITYSPPLNKAIRLRIWVYGKLEYDKWSDHHKQELKRALDQ